MNLLILGGTSFLGRHLTEQALARGHDVTLFNRGTTNADLYPEAQKLRGDRSNDLSALEGKPFDSVIDTSGYLPPVVERTVAALKDNVPHYLFVSTISTYEDTGAPTIDEDSPVFEWDPALEDETEVKPEHYGRLKAECERRVITAYGDKAMIVRPGLIIGRYDKTGRFTYWPQRFSKGGRLLVPDYLDFPVQVIDAADLASWCLDLCERKAHGTLNATGPAKAITLGDVLDACEAIAPAGTTREIVSEAFLAKHGVGGWMELPLWIPRAAKSEAMMRADVTRMRDAGLRYRPLSATINDVLAEIEETGAFLANQSLTIEREAELLALWDQEKAQ